MATETLPTQVELPTAGAIWTLGEKARQSESSHVGSATGGWIVSPWFDLLFVCNVLWLLALLPAYVTPQGDPYAAFFVAYFIATPHRWMTILLAATDRDRRYGRTWLFVLIAVVTAVAIVAVHRIYGSYERFALFDAILIGWHFASQHAGILRIYARKSGGGRRWLETWPPRVFILYASMRLMPGLEYAVAWAGLDVIALDWAMLGIPAVMLSVELLDRPWRRIPKLTYLASVSGLYSCLILSAQMNNAYLSFALLGAATVYHSVEYMALTTHYARRRQTHGSDGAFRRMARHWPTIFAWFVVSCGLVYSFGDSLIVVLWFGINLWASMLHCVFDGMMWKLRDPATSDALAAEVDPAP